MARMVWVIQSAKLEDGKLKGRLKKYKRVETAPFEVPYAKAYNVGAWVEVTQWGGTPGRRKAVKFKKLK
ncbi:hypothetical protein GF371_04285 [Candidatus Woesearchaeota archaeon]|nr:hypothetical protein [Candidatus Woesearchaeota archaeon]